MQAHQIARAIEAIWCERPCIVLRNAEVAAQRIRTSHKQFTDLTWRHFIIVPIHEPNFIIRGKRSSDRFHTNLDRIVETNITEQSLSHPKDFLHLTVRNEFFSVAFHLWLE